MFNHLGLCMIYREVQRSKCSYAQNTLHQCNEVHGPLPSHILNKIFTLAALTNSDHPDQSSPSGRKSSLNIVMSLSSLA